MRPDLIFRSIIFILAALIGLLKDSIAAGADPWQARHEAEGIAEYQLANGLP